MQPKQHNQKEGTQIQIMVPKERKVKYRQKENVCEKGKFYERMTQFWSSLVVNKGKCKPKYKKMVVYNS